MDLAKKINIGTIAASHGVNSFYLFFLIPILPVIAKDFGLNYVEVGLIASVYAFANGVFQFPISFLGDYLGRWRSVMAISFLVQAGGVFLYGLAPTYPIFLAFVFLSGLGCSAYHPPAIAIITRESPAQRGFMMGIFVGGGDVGSIITPTLVGWLTVYLSSWRMAAHWSLIAGIVMALIVWWRFEDVPRDTRPIKQAARATLRAFLGNTPLLLLVLLSTFRITGFRGLMTFLPLLLAQSFGFDIQGIGWTMSAFFVIGMVMTVIIGKLSDSGSKTKYIVVLTFMCGLSLITLSWADTVPGVLAAIAAVGFFLAPVPSLVLAVGTELVEERHRASAVGLVYAANEGASTLSPLIGGLVAEAFGLRFSFLFYALLFLAATAVALVLHRVGGRLKAAAEEGAA